MSKIPDRTILHPIESRVLSRCNIEDKKAEKDLVKRAEELGYKKHHVDILIKCIQEKSRVVIGFDATKCVQDKMLIEVFMESQTYKNVFETRSKSLPYLRYRMRHENRLHPDLKDIKRKSEAHLLPKYGFVDVLTQSKKHFTGRSCRHYGDSFFILRKEVLLERTTLASDNSDKAQAVGNVYHCAQVLLATPGLLFKTLMIAANFPEKMLRQKHKNNEHLEAHVFGPIDFSKDVEALVVKHNYVYHPVFPKMIAFTQKFGISLVLEGGISELVKSLPVHLGQTSARLAVEGKAITASWAKRGSDHQFRHHFTVTDNDSKKTYQERWLAYEFPRKEGDTIRLINNRIVGGYFDVPQNVFLYHVRSFAQQTMEIQKYVAFTVDSLVLQKIPKFSEVCAVVQRERLYAICRVSEDAYDHHVEWLPPDERSQSKFIEKWQEKGWQIAASDSRSLFVLKRRALKQQTLLPLSEDVHAFFHTQDQLKNATQLMTQPDQKTLEKFWPMPGSTQLFQNEKYELFVLKHNGDKRHYLNEIVLRRIYRFFNVKVPACRLIETNLGPTLVSHYVSGNPLHVLDEKTFRDAKKKIAEHFVLDAFLGAWNFQHILIDRTGEVWRTSLTSGFKFKANGSSKPYGDIIHEFEEMRNTQNSPFTADIFREVTPQDIYRQAQFILSKDFKEFLSLVPLSLGPVIRKRYDALKKISKPS